MMITLFPQFSIITSRSPNTIVIINQLKFFWNRERSPLRTIIHHLKLNVEIIFAHTYTVLLLLMVLIYSGYVVHILQPLSCCVIHFP